MRLYRLIRILFLMAVCGTACVNAQSKFIYNGDNLEMTADHVRDSMRTITIDGLSNNKPKLKTKLKGSTTPMVSKLWDIALSDAELNIVTNDSGATYFGAGRTFGMIVYTRDISYSGILGLNVLYPEQMLNSIKHTRDVRLGMGFLVSKDNSASNIKAPWLESELPENEFLKKYHTNSYLRRTDDVVWLWATMDLFEKNPSIAEWEWMYNCGKRSFEELYLPFFDTEDGLYKGQASFIDIHFGPNNKTTGYPQNWTKQNCVEIKSTSTNCLYYQGLKAMVVACNKTKRNKEAKLWQKRADSLRKAILKELRFADGSFCYFKSFDGTLENRREALGTAFSIITGIVNDKEAVTAISKYPFDWRGVPLFDPFFPMEKTYHNNTSWPFVDTFFLWAKEIAEKKDYKPFNAALLSRMCIADGTFHEYFHFPNKKASGSKSQLWSAASFINVCYRAGLIE